MIHFGQAIKYRKWYLLYTAVFCGIIEVAGWSGRLWSSFDPFLDIPFQIQFVRFPRAESLSTDQFIQNNLHDYCPYTSHSSRVCYIRICYQRARDSIQQINAKMVHHDFCHLCKFFEYLGSHLSDNGL